MNREEIEKQLKLSKKQSKDERYYYYLCSEFNAINYCINLEKYTNKLQKENKILKENAENNDKVVDKVNWENQLLKKEIHQLKDTLESSNLIKYLPNIAKLISSGEIPKEVYNKYLGNVPCGFMNEKDLTKWFLEKSDNQ